jgi:hypothetical protein
MATTTNYSWSTPDDTALVKDGAAAIRSLGTAIDTTVFNNAGAAIAKTIVDAKGDLIVASGADAVARLAVGGTNGHVLTVNSGATNGVEWAAAPGGGMTLISTTTLSGASVTLSSIPQTYIHLQLVIRDALPATDDVRGRLRLNSDSTANRHKEVGLITNPGTFDDTAYNFGNQMDNSVTQNLFVLTIYDYTNTVTWKMITAYNLNVNATTTTSLNAYLGMGAYNQTDAITSLDIFPSSGNWTSGTVLLYGVK